MPPRTPPGRQATRTLQTLRGIGKLYAGRQFKCEVRYTVTVQQGIVYAGSQPVAGATDIKGTLVVVDRPPRLSTGSRLWLEMEDGRTAALVIVTASCDGSTYGIQVKTLGDRG
jgi:hypothetical protein